MQEIDEEDQPYRFEVRLLIKHPRIHPDLITKRLGLMPHMTHLAGTPRKNPIGTPLPGVYRESAWSYSFRVDGKRHFFEDVAKLIDKVEPHARFLSEIADTGGTISLIVSLPAEINIGDTLPIQELARLSALKIDLGIEVFPKLT